MKVTGRIQVELGPRSYAVLVGVGLLTQAGRLTEEALAARLPAGRARRCVIITDSNVGPLYARSLQESLSAAGSAVETITFPAGEENKNLATYGTVIQKLLGQTPPIDRRTLIVSLGGGVVSDLAGFVAATALRGLDYISLPTTLLAAVDASVGGKTGLDVEAGKNLVGAFHQPRLVMIDAALLASLPVAQLQGGLAECVKHAVIRDATLLNFIAENSAAILAADADVLAELILRNVAIKAAVVAADERESSLRALLNLGHTVGHAVETAAGYGGLSHGQAVALGLVAACHIACARGLMHSTHADRVRAVLTGVGLPVKFADLPGLKAAARKTETLLPIMQRDKKASGGVVRFVLPKGLGDAAVFDDVSLDEIQRAVEFLRSA